MAQSSDPVKDVIGSRKSDTSNVATIANFPIILHILGAPCERQLSKSSN